MSSPSAVACREIFDENSQPSAEEISDYAQQLGIDPESESHLLSLAKDGLMQALPAPWKAYYDEKLETHYYYNEDTKKTQWEHPLDNVYRELVKKVRDASVVDDTCASVQELLTSEENTKNLERVETKVESDEELSTDSENHQSDVKEATATLTAPRRLAPLGRPPLSPLTRMDKKLGDMRISPLRRSAENPTSKRTPDSSTCKPLLRNISDRDLFSRPSVERPKLLFKQQSEVIDLKMSVLSPEEESYPGMGRMDRALPLSGRSSMFLRVSKSDLPSPDTEKSLPLDSVTKSDPPKGILREKVSDSHHRRPDSASAKHKNTSFEDDRKSVRFKLESLPDPTVSPSSNSSSEPNDKPTSVISAARPPLPPRQDTVTEPESPSGRAVGRRVLRPPPADYIKPDLFQKNFGKICDLLRPDDGKEPPLLTDKDRPRSPMIPQKNKISINLMESIESETSIDSPDREFANLDLNDLDESNDPKKPPDEPKETNPKEELSRTSDKSIKSDSVPQIKVPSLELPKNSDTDSKSIDDSKMSKSSFEKIKMSPLSSEMRSPRLDYNINKVWSPLSTFKPLSKTLSPTLKPESKGLTSPRLDGVIISQGKSNSDNVVVVYQFETNDESPKPIKSPLIPDMGRDMIERSKTDERRRLDLSLQKELESIRAEWSAKERKMRAELQEELKELEEKFLNDKRVRLSEQASRHQREMEEALAIAEKNHQLSLQQALQEIEDRYNKESEIAEQKHAENMQRLKEQYRERLVEQQEQLEIENERALSILQEQFEASLKSSRAAAAQRSEDVARAEREQHAARLHDMRLDYRAEVERLRTQHLCHVSELRARLTAQRDSRDAADKYKHLKEKYHKLKQDVKMSIERRNKRREMSMTTGSETEKSNSHKANPSLERCKELNETSVSACIEPEPRVINSLPKNNDNETSASESNQRTLDNNNEDWKIKRDNAGARPPAGSRSRAPRRAAVAFREPHHDKRKLRDHRPHCDKDAGATTDFQDSSDATTADEKPKENVNGPGRRRCFTRLKSASTSRLNYSPNGRGSGWSSPLEALRLQLRKLDDLEDQFPDLACQPAYSLRYPFTDLGSSCGDSAELEFVRHRALVEREGVRRARDALRARRRALRGAAPAQEPREATELEVGLHRARALLQEKEIRLRHIERALAALAPPPHQEATSSSGSSGAGAGARGAAGGAVLRSLRALHADVRDIWRALDARRAATASPETSTCNAATTSQTRMTLSAPEPMIVPPDASDAAVCEKARGLRAWLQTAP